ncbi:MAG: hypothetical protein V4555_12075, partial [Acidobacteriota bacterium]
MTWQVNGVTGGTSTTGAISSTGLYTPPATVPSPNTVTITAVSQASASSVGSFTESILYPVASVTAAARLLDQATFGPTLADIQHVEDAG